MNGTSALIESVAFVVIGRNEGERLRACLTQVLRHSRKAVYVDSASTDGSPEIAEAMGALTVALPAGEVHNAAKARNAGFAEVRKRFPRCRYVQFIDGDCVLADGWIEEAVTFLDANPSAAIVCGRRYEAHPDASAFNRLIDAEWATPVGRALSSGGDALVRADAFQEVGGFNPAMKAGEEPEMAARLRKRGWEIWRIAAPMTEHDAKLLHFGQWWSRCVRGGFGYAQVWGTTFRSGERVFERQLISAAFWILVLPIVVLIAAALAGEPLLLLLVPAAYLIQVARIASASGLSAAGWQRGALLMLAKLAETVGAISYFLGKKPQQLSDYKAAR